MVTDVVPQAVTEGVELHSGSENCLSLLSTLSVTAVLVITAVLSVIHGCHDRVLITVFVYLPAVLITYS